MSVRPLRAVIEDSKACPWEQMPLTPLRVVTAGASQPAKGQYLPLGVGVYDYRGVIEGAKRWIR
jgi:hypothetical protein